MTLIVTCLIGVLAVQQADLPRVNGNQCTVLDAMTDGSRELLVVYAPIESNVRGLFVLERKKGQELGLVWETYFIEFPSVAKHFVKAALVASKGVEGFHLVLLTGRGARKNLMHYRVELGKARPLPGEVSREHWRELQEKHKPTAQTGFVITDTVARPLPRSIHLLVGSKRLMVQVDRVTGDDFYSLDLEEKRWLML